MTSSIVTVVPPTIAPIVGDFSDQLTGLGVVAPAVTDRIPFFVLPCKLQY